METNLEKEIEIKEKEIKQYEEIKNELNLLKENNKKLRDELISLVIKNKNNPPTQEEVKPPTDEEIIKNKIEKLIKQMKGNFNK